MNAAYSVFADGLSQTPVFASPLDRGRLFLKIQMLNGLAVVDKFLERVDANFQVHVEIVLCDLFIASRGFDAAWDHGLVGDQKQGANGYFIMEACDEKSGGFHIYCHGADAAQVGFEFFVVLPDAAVGGVDSTCPIVPIMIADGG